MKSDEWKYIDISTCSIHFVAGTDGIEEQEIDEEVQVFEEYPTVDIFADITGNFEKGDDEGDDLQLKFYTGKISELTENCPFVRDN